jgi:beta-lactamase regulating signal transducer with metallopeptidase domain
MISLSIVVSYIFLFVALCIFVFLSLALINIFGKSYQPTLVVPLIAIVVVLFAINTVAGYGAVRKTFQNISDGVNETTSPTPSKPSTVNTKGIF